MNVDGDSAAAAAGAAFPAVVGGDRPEDKFTDKKQTTHKKNIFYRFKDSLLKFSFSKKATKICAILVMVLTFTK